MSKTIEAIDEVVVDYFKLMTDYMRTHDERYNIALLAVKKSDSQEVVPIICLVENTEDPELTRLKPIFELKPISEENLDNYEEPAAKGETTSDDDG